MTIQENVPLAPLTTLGVGGAARFFAVAESVEEVEEALAFARERSLPLFVLGEGSNVLIPDEGISGVVLKMAVRGITVEDRGDRAVLVAGAGALWDDVVDAASAHHLFGIENLAGIPGSVAGAAVQNIGAYGAELSRVFDAADVVDSETGTRTQIARDAAAFAYRTSFFKQHPRFCISRVTFALTKDAEPDLSYADVARARAAGAPLATPAEIARTIRAIRAKKFPQDEGEGTAGSFFKNPVIPRAHAEALAGRFPGLPTFPREGLLG
ncbi:MAG TPA: UDP-N-acetylmuramate dehydrogenase, partial [Candidatus Paceibacterota bacterium]|nr:UDP-N-acetylmuramate dehydrogenase [Candidatus Paceibacterota bacterium]